MSFLSLMYITQLWGLNSDFQLGNTYVVPYGGQKSIFLPI